MRRTAKGHKTVSFFSHCLTNDGKLEALKQKAKLIRDLRNAISAEVTARWSEFVNLSKFDFYSLIQTCTDLPRRGISGNEFQRAVFAVYEAYARKFESVQSRTSGFTVSQWIVTRYKKATKFKSKGDVKSTENKSTTTQLGKVLNYMARKNLISADKLVRFINWAKQVSTTSTAGTNLSLIVVSIELYIAKFGITRIVNLVAGRVNRIVAQSMSNPIRFESLTYENFNQFKGGMLTTRKSGSNGDNWNAYFMVAAIGATSSGRIAIPVSYSLKYHGPKRHFDRLNVPYTIIFEPNRVRITVGYECEREINSHNTKISGVDLNTKHNLFCTDGLELDFDRKLVAKAIRVQSSDTLESRKLHYRRAVEQSIKNQIVKLARHLKSKGTDHVVIEDIQKFTTNFIRIEGTRINRLLSTLRFGMIKTWISQIFEKNGIQVTITHAHYSSQQCNHCGHIDRANRTSQENFTCVACGHRDNADHNARKNLADRLNLDVPRKGLFVEKDGRFEMKRLSKDKIKSILSAVDTLKETRNGPVHSCSI